MNLSNRALAAMIAVLLVLCCLTGGAFIVVLGASTFDLMELAQVEPTVISPPTVFPTNTATRMPPTVTRLPSATSTLVVQPQTGVGTPTPKQSPTRVPTLGASPYNIVVPTPGAPTTNYPVTFNSTFKVITYTVAGTTITDLRRALDAKALTDPHEPTGRYYAMTEWLVSSDWRWSSTTRGCEMEGAGVTVVLTMTLPALTTRQGVATDVLTRWDNFLANTVAHEKGHVIRTLDGARDYQRTIGTLPAQPSCQSMRPTLDALFKQHLGLIDRANVQYDAETNHGMTEGAVFP